MSAAILLINVIAFSALFTVYSSPRPIERPVGVRRMLQTYAGQNPAGSYPTRKPVWELGGGQTDGV